MKKFLKDLEKELKKLKINEDEIKEILADHSEMIETALNEGLSVDDLESKFGVPSNIAKELHNDNLVVSIKDSSIDEFEKNELIEGFELFESFNNVENSYNVRIKLVSADVLCKTHNKETIEVYITRNKEKYECLYENGEFILNRKKKSSLFEFNKGSDFVVFLPSAYSIGNFDFSTTSGDIDITGISTNLAKISTVSGDALIYNLSSNNGLFSTVSGDLEIEDVKLKEVKFNSVSGDVEIKNMEVKGEMTLKTVSGDFELYNVVSESTTIGTVSGDCEGHEVYTNSISLTSISGDIEIKNTDLTRLPTILKKKTVSGDLEVNGVKL